LSLGRLGLGVAGMRRRVELKGGETGEDDHKVVSGHGKIGSSSWRVK